jgi:3-oxoacyl-[acyl-carrier protein] reductase
MDLGLSSKVFVCTAASGGLGLASARELVNEGAHVVLVARRAEALAVARAELGESNALSLAADLTDPATPEAAVKLALEGFGRVDGAFVSVGGPPKGHVLENSDEQWQAAFSSVFLAALRMSRAVLDVNKAARLGFVLSSSAKAALPNMAISNGLRPGLAMLVKQLANEIAPDGGRAFALLPGRIATARMVELLGHEPTAADAVDSGIPMERMGQPEEFGRVAAFLLSDAASYVTGVALPVDGGLLPNL